MISYSQVSEIRVAETSYQELWQEGCWYSTVGLPRSVTANSFICRVQVLALLSSQKSQSNYLFFSVGRLLAAKVNAPFLRSGRDQPHQIYIAWEEVD